MPKLRYWIVGAILACLWACGGPEQATVDQFFRAAQSDDAPTLASMSAVSPPLPVASWNVVEVSSRTTEPFGLPELSKRLKAAESARNIILEKGRNYLNDHTELDEIIPKLQEDPEYKFSGKRGEIQEEWMALVEERKEKERAYQDLKREATHESGLVGKSVLNRSLKPEDLDGEVQVTEMLLNLKSPDQDTELPFKVTLHRYDLKNPQTDRVEPARWVIVSIEGANEAARAAAEAERSRGIAGSSGGESSRPSGGGEATRAAATPPAAAQPAAEGGGQESVQRALAYQPKELHGVARVQILAPETRTEGNEVISTIRVRNASRDWISRFTVTEYWYDQQGTATRGGSRTHEGRFMPGEVLELELRTRKNPNFYQNQFEFSHANGEVTATVVSGFPKTGD